MSWFLPVARTFAIFPQSPAILKVQRVTGRKQKFLEIFPILGGEVTVLLLFTKRSKFLLPSPPQCGADEEQRQKPECVGV